MTLKRFLWLVVIACIVGAYAGGYLPEHQQRLLAQSEAAMLRTQLADAESRVRAARLLGELLALTDAATAMNYGEAQKLSSQFFNDVRADAARTQVPAIQSVLESVLQDRDQVTGTLARGESGAVGMLRRQQIRLREALGYAVPAPAESTTPSPPPVSE